MISTLIGSISHTLAQSTKSSLFKSSKTKGFATLGLLLFSPSMIHGENLSLARSNITQIRTTNSKLITLFYDLYKPELHSFLNNPDFHPIKISTLAENFIRNMPFNEIEFFDEEGIRKVFKKKDEESIQERQRFGLERLKLIKANNVHLRNENLAKCTFESTLKKINIYCPLIEYSAEWEPRVYYWDSQLPTHEVFHAPMTPLNMSETISGTFIEGYLNGQGNYYRDCEKVSEGDWNNGRLTPKSFKEPRDTVYNIWKILENAGTFTLTLGYFTIGTIGLAALPHPLRPAIFV